MAELTIDQIKSRVRILVALILTVVICISAWSIVAERNDVITMAERQAEGYAQALAEHSESAFAESDRVLRDVLEDIRRDGNAERIDRYRLFELLHRQSEGSPQIGALFIVDKNGVMFNNSIEFPSRQIDLSDRDYFRFYLTTPGAGLSISKPVMSRLVNRWRFNLMRPLNRPNEPFAGLLAVSFEVEYFKKFFSSASLGRRGRVALIHVDGAPLVFEPYVEKVYESNLANSPLLRDKLPISGSGTYHIEADAIEKAPRIVSYRRLNRFPVVALVSLHMDDVLKSWTYKALLQSSLTFGLCIVILILTRLIFRHLGRLRIAQSKVGEQQVQLMIKAAQIDVATDAILQIDGTGRLVQFNQALCQMTGYSREELTGIRIHDIELPEFAARTVHNIRLLSKLGQLTFESAYLSRDGTVAPVEIQARTMESEGQALVLCIVRDITQRKRDELRETTRLKILEEMATGAVLKELLEQIVHFVEQESSGTLCSVLLADEPREFLRHGVAHSLPDFYNQDVDGLEIGPGLGSCGTAAYLRQRVVVEDIAAHPYWKGFKSAAQAGLRSCWSEPILSSNNEILGTFAIYSREVRSPTKDDILLIESAAHLASIAIARVRGDESRKKLEDQLWHVQRIEAIGQLAGGIAHDFNNLLTPILVYAEMIGRVFPEGDPQRKKVDGIVSAAQKAKELTQKLLSFGRKQLLCMEGLDLNAVIVSFQDIMRRTIRENISIELQLAPGGVHVLADQGQIEQILLNLMVNAQDAISGNGAVTIETGYVVLNEEYARLHPGMKTGAHILMAFTDNGCGMEDEVLRHIFEPFFTTKAVGHGTGLGLATVYGIVKQHDGYIAVKSQVGLGTTFTIYLPENAGELRVNQGLPEIRNDEVQDLKNKLILMVDDNEMIRDMAAEVLESSGYRVLVADSPSGALEIAASKSGLIDLLVSDVVMPGMTGPELYEVLRNENPMLPVLFISGYTNDVVIHNGTLEEEVNFLPKPFTMEQFLKRVGLALRSS